MRHLNKIATAFCAAALGLLSMTSCEGGDLYSVDSPDWISAKVEPIRARVKSLSRAFRRMCIP